VEHEALRGDEEQHHFVRASTIRILEGQQTHAVRRHEDKMDEVLIALKS
jgi:hypothetical protein